jgi:hypothetical protein
MIVRMKKSDFSDCINLEAGISAEFQKFGVGGGA